MEFCKTKHKDLWLEGQEIETAFVGGDNYNSAENEDCPNPEVPDDPEKHPESSVDPNPGHQDGGYGWVVVAASFALTAIANIFVDGFSVTYEATTDYFQAGKGMTGWIGSLSLSLGSLLGEWETVRLHLCVLTVKAQETTAKL